MKKNKFLFILLIFFVPYFCKADSLRLKNGELLKGRLCSYSPKVVQFAIENNLVFKFDLKDIDFLSLSTSNAIIQLIKKNSKVSSFELIGITSESLYLKDGEGVFCLDTNLYKNIAFSLQNEKGNVSFYESEIDKLTIQELWNEILIISNSKNIIDWIDFNKFNLKDYDVLFYEDTWKVLKEYIPQEHHNFLWQLMESYTKAEKNIEKIVSRNDFPIRKEKLREDFLYRIYRFLGKIN